MTGIAARTDGTTSRVAATSRSRSQTTAVAPEATACAAKRVAVAGGAGDAEEQGARRHIARVIGDAADCDGGVAAHHGAGETLGQADELHAGRF